MASTPLALILDCTGTSLTDEERRLFAEANPYGFILFARNCESPAQVKALVASMRESVGRADVPVLIDQEGGRVARLKPPHWRPCPAAGKLAALGAREAAEAVYLNGRLIAQELMSMGINVDCAPVADMVVEGAHDIIGDRAYGTDPARVAELAREMARGLLAGGVMPVLKHIPGHGRALADSHESLPVVETSLAELERTDFVPFRALKDLPMAMTAHVIYTALDAQAMVTVSARAIGYIRREIGFEGLLMSDDLSMKAMSGSIEDRTRAVLDAGCDVALLCNASFEDRVAALKAARPMEDMALDRSARAFAQAENAREGVVAEMDEARLKALMTQVA